MNLGAQRLNLNVLQVLVKSYGLVSLLEKNVCFNKETLWELAKLIQHYCLVLLESFLYLNFVRFPDLLG